MTDQLQKLREAYASALHQYLAQPQEAGRMHAYDLGRRVLSCKMGAAELALLHAQALAPVLAGTPALHDQARLTRLAGEFLSETLGPYEMMLRGYQEANELLKGLNQTLEERVEERTKALRESEKRFRILAEMVPSFIWTADPKGSITYANERWYSYCGLTPEANATNWSGLVLHPDDHDRCVDAWSRALAEGRPYEIEVRNRRHDGAFRWFVTRAEPLRDESGRIVAWFGVTTDIHDLKELQAALKEADSRKDEFLAMLAHELRNPLAPIRNGLQILRLVGKDPAAVADAMEVMERQVHYLVRLIDDLMDISRITRGKIELRKAPFDLATVLRHAVEISRPHIETAQHELKVSLPRRPITVQVDLARVAQVVANLLNNASKYTEQAGRIWLTGEREGEHALIRVRDTGIGIPLDMLPRVFEMFTQIDNSLGRTQGGLGIGLTLARRLVELHGGSIEAKSKGPGTGCEFIVRLPLAKGTRPKAAKPNPKGWKHTSQRILVVDDNHDSADSLGTLLRLIGNEVRIAYDGLDAVEAAVSFQPDVILMDIGLPSLNGYDAARKIRQHPSGCEPVLIALTGWGQEQDRLCSHDAGFDHHLVKPVDLDVLQELLASVGRSKTKSRSSKPL